MNRAERAAMVARGRADLSVRRQCAARIGALRGLSQAGAAGCRRAGADAVARRADLATRFVACPDEGRGLMADSGDAAPGPPSGQPEVGCSDR